MAPGTEPPRDHAAITTDAAARTERHWADALAAQWIERRGPAHVVATGKSPSGTVHIGFLREMIVADVMCRALRAAGAAVRLIFIVDNYDPLRKVPAGLPESFGEHLGKPISEIPDPLGRAANYAAANLAPFLRTLHDVGIQPELYYADQLYKTGQYAPAITRTLERQDRVRTIMVEECKRQLPPDWSPVNPICAHCGRLSETTVTGFDLARTLIQYRCDCGHSGAVDYRTGGAKLAWRVDWPARWWFLGVTGEPFGKDHAASGGSFTTARRIAPEVFDYATPEPLIYEWIELKGEGAMSSSKGIVITAEQILEAVPPEVLRFHILRPRLNRHITFDPGAGLLKVFDDYERLGEAVHADADGSVPVSDRRSYELSYPAGVPKAPPVRVAFRHLVTLTQVADGDEDRLRDMVARTCDPSVLDRWDDIRRKAEYAKNWVERFGAESDRITLAGVLPGEAAELGGGARGFLGTLHAFLAAHPEADAEAIHNAIYEMMRETELKPADAFGALYLVFLGRRSGPKAGWFLRALDREFVLRRLAEASKER